MTTDPIIVVSGLPRSGTSMLMQVLAAGGIPVVTDDRRAADADNPRGYFEVEAVKRLAADSTFLAGCAGRAIKIVTPLLAHLPPQYRYQVLVMDRDLREILASQRAMLARLGKGGARLDEGRLAETLERQVAQALAAVSRLPSADVLHVSHAAMLQEPRPTVSRIASFLGRDDLDTETMARVVAPELYRHRHRAPAEPGAGLPTVTR